jgi:glycerophosphoryl diester phosphodiesterase
MEAFKKARELGAPGIELDVHVCASGELVVAHDDSFSRTAGDNRTIAELSLQEIRRIDVGAFFVPHNIRSGEKGRTPLGAGIVPPGDRAFSGVYPPLLEEVAEEFCPDMYIDIELKTRKTRDDPLPGLVAEKIRSLGDRALRAVTVSSFNPISLAAFKKHCPRIPTSVIWSTDREVPPALRYGFGRFIARCDYVKPQYRQVGRFSRFKMALVEGRPLVPWTIDDPVLAAEMLKTGCEGIITNRPQDMPFPGGPDAR